MLCYRRAITAFDESERALLPIAFRACTLNVYEPLGVSPVTVADTAVAPFTVTDRAAVPELFRYAETTWLVITPPPLSPRVQRTVAVLPAFAVAVPIVGVEGATGIVTLNGVEVAPSPTKLTARIETEYVVPFVRPVITIGDAVVPVWRVAQLVPPSIEYLYEVIGLVPAAPAVNLTESDPEEGVMVIPVGTLGALGVGGGGATIGPPTGSRYNR